MNDVFKMSRGDIPKVRKMLLEKQNGVCPICGKDLTRIAPINIVIDHDHATGVVRAALHRGCNRCEGVILKAATTYGKARGIAGVTELFKRLIEFWETHSEPQTNFIYYNFKPRQTKQTRKRS